MIVKEFLIRYLGKMVQENSYIIGNWKMHGDAVMAHAWVESVAAQAAKMPSHVEVAVCPPATLLASVTRAMIGSRLHAGGQDCSTHAQGAYTGEISAAMLREAGCRYVIVGHSERRQYHLETSETVAAKAQAALAAGLKPIICIGETLAEREEGLAETVVARQIAESIPASHQPLATGHFLVAYEPVWAIGTGRSATAADIARMHGFIAQRAAGVPVLYGGSVKPANAREILTTKAVSGVLVGGASLNAQEFNAIIAGAMGA